MEDGIRLQRNERRKKIKLGHLFDKAVLKRKTSGHTRDRAISYNLEASA